jgi:hypothetical protein
MKPFGQESVLHINIAGKGRAVCSLFDLGCIETFLLYSSIHQVQRALSIPGEVERMRADSTIEGDEEKFGTQT